MARLIPWHTGTPKEGRVRCDHCGGTGRVHSHNPECWDCEGSGWLRPIESEPIDALNRSNALLTRAEERERLFTLEQDQLRQQLLEVEAALQQARQALKKYGQHTGRCQVDILMKNGCTCGLDAALKATEGQR